MDRSEHKKGLLAFYENLAQVQFDLDYYLNPIGLSRRDAIIKLLQARPGDVIGDLGCGEGLISIKLLGLNCRIFGCDISPSRARLAAVNGIAAAAADVSLLPYKSEFFDRVICTEVVEHVINPASTLRDIWRVLRVEAVAVFTVPVDEHLERTLLDIPKAALENESYYEIKEKYRLKNSHISSFSVDSFQRLLDSCGFYVSDVAFTYNYAVKRPRLLGATKTLCHTVVKLGLPITLFSQVENLVKPLIFASYEKQSTKHHIIAKVKKLGQHV